MRVTQLKNHFLVAMPTISCDVFCQSVVYIYQHDKQCSQGIMINKTLHLSLNGLLKKLQLDDTLPPVPHMSLYYGGPVNHNKAYVVSQSDDHEFPGIKTLSLSSCYQPLSQLAQGDGRNKSLVALGCAQWRAGQLEQEIRENYWLVVPYDAHTLFETPHALRWNISSRALGVDMCQVSGVCGSA
ncbi:MAG: YqgE/AlgH family protein [Coxiellaceae bacterium]|nr:YqgE/AlgH family protein [Coxiellaceae bacterium]